MLWRHTAEKGRKTQKGRGTGLGRELGEGPKERATMRKSSEKTQRGREDALKAKRRDHRAPLVGLTLSLGEEISSGKRGRRRPRTALLVCMRVERTLTEVGGTARDRCDPLARQRRSTCTTMGSLHLPAWTRPWQSSRPCAPRPMSSTWPTTLASVRVRQGAAGPRAASCVDH